VDEIDKEALTRALELTKAESEHAEQIESMLKDRSWEEVAQFAAKHQQCKNLQLKPREIPPCHGAVNLAAAGTDADDIRGFSFLKRDHFRIERASLTPKRRGVGAHVWEPGFAISRFGHRFGTHL
jgi:hypothetical protein